MAGKPNRSLSSPGMLKKLAIPHTLTEEETQTVLNATDKHAKFEFPDNVEQFSPVVLSPVKLPEWSPDVPNFGSNQCGPSL